MTPEKITTILRIIQNAVEEIDGPDYGGTVSEATLHDMRDVIHEAVASANHINYAP